MKVNTTVFGFEKDLVLIKSSARMSTQFKDDIIMKMYNVMNRHIKRCAMTRSNAVISTLTNNNVGIVKCDGEVAYIVKIDKYEQMGNVIYYSNHAIIIDSEHRTARVHAMPFENSAPLNEFDWDMSDPKKTKKCLKACLKFIDDIFIEYMIELIKEYEKENGGGNDFDLPSYMKLNR